EELVFGNQAARQGHLARQLRGILGFFEDIPKLIFVDEAQVDEHLADLTATAVCSLSLANRSRLGRRLLGAGLLGVGGRFLAVAGGLGNGLLDFAVRLTRGGFFLRGRIRRRHNRFFSLTTEHAESTERLW